MADNTEYSKKHPDYSESYQRRGLALDLYEGGRRVEENPAYLIRHPYETQKQYDIRFQRATYRNFAAPIVDVFASFINEGRPPRVLPAKLEDMQDNVDRLGTKANTFFADVTRLAAAGASGMCRLMRNRGGLHKPKRKKPGAGSGLISSPLIPRTYGIGKSARTVWIGLSSTAQVWRGMHHSPRVRATKP